MIFRVEYINANIVHIDMLKRMEKIDQEIRSCYNELGRLNVKFDSSPVSRPLIVSTGDISDVDGFFALAKYAKTGADVLFVMNYPAWIECDHHHSKLEQGLGFAYTANEYMKTNFDANCKALEKQVIDKLKKESVSEEEKTRKSEELQSRFSTVRAKYLVLYQFRILLNN